MARKHRTKVHQKERNKNDQSCIWHQDKKIHILRQDSTSGRTNQVRHPRFIHLLQLPPSKKRVCSDQRTQQAGTWCQICCSSTLLPLDSEKKHNSTRTIAYAIRNIHLTRSIVKTAIKEAPTEEALCQRIAEQECFTKLVQTIITAITDVLEAENPSVGYKGKIDKINGVIEFIREKGMKPSCKILSGETVFSDFTTAADDTTTMDLAMDIVNTKMPADKIVKQWRNQHNNVIRSRNKIKQKELLEKRWGEYLAPPRDPKDPETSSVISLSSNTTGTSTYQKEQWITDYEPNVSEITTVHRPTITRYGADIPKEVLVGEYLARAKTLIKSKIKHTALWHSDIDETDVYHICNELLKRGLKSRMLRRVSKFKTYKDLFNYIEGKWEWSYFMEDDFTGKEYTPNTAAEVDEIYAWNKTTTDNLMEGEMLAEVNEMYHKYGRYPTLWILDTQTQTTELQSSIQGRSRKPETIHSLVQPQAPEHHSSKSSLHIQWYHTTCQCKWCIFNMGAPFSTHQQVPYNYQPNQLHTPNQQYHNNSFAEKQNSATSQSDATALVEKLQQLILMHKNQDHQVNEVQMATPKPSSTWDLKAAAELPLTQEDQSKWLTARETQETTSTAMNPECPPTMQGEENHSPHTGHQRANTMHIPSQSKAHEANRKLPNKANSKHFNKKWPQRTTQLGQ